MAGIYSRAIGQSRKIEEEKGKALGEAGQKKLATEEKVYDVEKEFQEKTENALSNAGWLKTAGGIIGGGLAMATGVGPLMAAVMAAGGTGLGSAAGAHQLKQAYKGDSMGKWKQGAQKKVKKGYNKDALMSMLQSGIMAGASATGGAASTATAGGEELTKAVAGEGTKAAGLSIDQTKALVAEKFKAVGHELSAEQLAGLDITDPKSMQELIKGTGMDKKKMFGEIMDKEILSQYDPSVGVQTSSLATGGPEAGPGGFTPSEGWQRNPFFNKGLFGDAGVGDPTFGEWMKQAGTNINVGMFGKQAGGNLGRAKTLLDLVQGNE